MCVCQNISGFNLVILYSITKLDVPPIVLPLRYGSNDLAIVKFLSEINGTIFDNLYQKNTC